MNEFPQFDESLLTAYLDNELNEAERLMVEDVLSRSEEARMLLDELQRIRTLVSGLRSIPLTRSFAHGPWNQIETNDSSLADMATAANNEKAKHEEFAICAEQVFAPNGEFPKVELRNESSSESSSKRAGVNWRLIASLAASAVIVATIGTFTWMRNSGGRNLASRQTAPESSSKSDNDLSFRSAPAPSVASTHEFRGSNEVLSDPGSRGLIEAAPPRSNGIVVANSDTVSVDDMDATANGRGSPPAGYGGGSGASSGFGGLDRSAGAGGPPPSNAGFGGGGLGGKSELSAAKTPSSSAPMLASQMPAPAPAGDAALLNAPASIAASQELKMNLPARNQTEQTSMFDSLRTDGSLSDSDLASTALVTSFFTQAEAHWRIEANDNADRTKDRPRSYEVPVESVAEKQSADSTTLRTSETGALDFAGAAIPDADRFAHRFALVPPGVVFEKLSEPATGSWTENTAQDKVVQDITDKQTAAIVHYRFAYVPEANLAKDLKVSGGIADSGSTSDSRTAESESSAADMALKEVEKPATSTNAEDSMKGQSGDSLTENSVRLNLWSFLNAQERSEYLFGVEQKAKASALTEDTNSVAASGEDSTQRGAEDAVPKVAVLNIDGPVAAGGGVGSGAGGSRAGTGGAAGRSEAGGAGMPGGAAESTLTPPAKKSLDGTVTELAYGSVQKLRETPVIEFVIPRDSWDEASHVLRRMGIPVPNMLEPEVSNLFYVATLSQQRKANGGDTDSQKSEIEHTEIEHAKSQKGNSQPSSSEPSDSQKSDPQRSEGQLNVVASPAAPITMAPVDQTPEFVFEYSTNPTEIDRMLNRSNDSAKATEHSPTHIKVVVLLSGSK